MIRFRRLFDLVTDADRRQLGEIQGIFRKCFPFEANVADTLNSLLTRKERRDFEPIILIAENTQIRILGFTVTFYFPDVRFAYLQYIASDPERPARGVGGALYEATREFLVEKGCRGMFLEVPPDEPEKLKDKELLAVNRKRMRFYERYGALPVQGTLFDELPNRANEGYLTMLLYDPLGRKGALRRQEARRAIEHVYQAQYGLKSNNAYVREVTASFRDDPVRLRARKHVVTRAVTPERGRWLRPIKVVVTEGHQIHHLKEKGYVERPVRVNAVLRGLEAISVEKTTLRHYSESHIRAVHDRHLVDYLAAVCSRLGPKQLVYPEVFPIRRPEKRPKDLESRAGYFCADTFTPLTSNAYIAARAAVNCALTAADLLLQGERIAYALCRPPGHHAERAVFGGFCYFNNAAIAANRLASHGSVAVLDIDYHHGNGTQDIFYKRNDVLFVSIHGHPNNAYPHFSGFADERGEGDGLGYNHNYPLRAGVNDEAYLEVLQNALRNIRRFKPVWLVVSLGFDIMKGDPTGSFVVSSRGMQRIAEQIGRLGMPTLIVQEGGYSILNLRQGAQSFFHGFSRTWY